MKFKLIVTALTFLVLKTLEGVAGAENIPGPADLSSLPPEVQQESTQGISTVPTNALIGPDATQVINSTPGYVYDPVGKRDPFRPFRDAKIGIGSLVGYSKGRTLEPLELFDVKSLQVVAIVWGIKKPKALVQDPEKKVHTVFKGMRIGKNDGVVAEIREGEVVVVEVFDYNGKATKESFVLPIKK